MAGSKDKTVRERRELSIEDAQKTRLRVAGKKVHSLEPYGETSAPKPGARKDLRKLGEWIKTKRLADEIKREQSVPEGEMPKK
jgi:hypothetical protein